MNAGPPPKPLPAPVGLNAELYEQWFAGRLVFQRCRSCGCWRHPPRYRCGRCGSPEWEWAPSSGRGELYTWTVVHQAMDPAFAADVPYAVVVVEMDEGVRMVAGVVDVGLDELALGLPLEVQFVPRGGEVVMPSFRHRTT